MTLPADYSRCHGLLPKLTQLNGQPQTLWSIDCPKRETCARYLQIERDDPERAYSYLAHTHAPTEACPTYINEE